MYYIISTQTHTSAITYEHMYACMPRTHVYIYIYIYILMYVLICTYMYIYTYICIYTFVRTRTRIFIYNCKYAQCIYLCVHTYRYLHVAQQPAHLPACPFGRPTVCPPIHVLARSRACPLACLLAHPPACPPAQLLAYPLAPPPTIARLLAHPWPSTFIVCSHTVCRPRAFTL